MSHTTLKTELPQLLLHGFKNVNAVVVSSKHTQGQNTGRRCITFFVDKKESVGDLAAEDIIPQELTIDGITYETDVTARPRARMLMASYSCQNQSAIGKLRGYPNAQLPMRGGQEILQFPTGWTIKSDNTTGQHADYLTQGTLGFFAIDNIDGNVVGVTNAHVAIDKPFLANSDFVRTPEQEVAYTANTYEPRTWPMDGKKYFPGAAIVDGQMIYVVSSRIKRYVPYTIFGRSDGAPEYMTVDGALLQMHDYPFTTTGSYNPSTPIISETSYRIWQDEDDDVQHTAYLPFATTAELDAFNATTTFGSATNPRMYITGRTTGPKGAKRIADEIVATLTDRDALDPTADPWPIGTVLEVTDEHTAADDPEDPTYYYVSDLTFVDTVTEGSSTVDRYDYVWEKLPSCRIGLSTLVPNANGAYTVDFEAHDGVDTGVSFGEIFEFSYRDPVAGGDMPADQGDSGSAVVAEFPQSGGGVIRKIIGLLFAGSPGADGKAFGLCCRIDNVAAQLNIRAWAPTTADEISGAEAILKNAPNTPDVLVADYETYANTPTITVGNVTYYQVGCTIKTDYPEYPLT
jgi:hypothetical protein